MPTRGPARARASTQVRLLASLGPGTGATVACAALTGVLLLGACSSDSGTGDASSTSQSATSQSSGTQPSDTPTPAPTDPVIAAVPPKAREYSASGAIAFVEHFFDRVNEAVTGPDTGLIPALSEPGCDACAGLQGMAVELKEQDLRAAAPMFSVRDPQFVAKRDETIMTIRFTLESHAVDILKADGSVASTRTGGSGDRLVAVQWRDDSWRILGAEAAGG